MLKKEEICAGHRASATCLLNQIETALAALSTDSEKLSQLKLSLHKKLELSKLLDLEIVELTSGRRTGRRDIKRTCVPHLTMIDKVLKSIPSPLTPVADTHAPTTSSATPPPLPHGKKVKLPKLSLPHFSANVTNWTTF